MLFTYRSLDDEEKRVEEATARIRHDLRQYVVTEPRRWIGLLSRMTRARALVGSNRIEGIHVSDEDAIAAVDGEDPANTDRDTWRAVVGYREAMDYILQRRQSPSFTISEDVLLAVHFMICQSDLAARPGQYRPGWVGVRDSRTGEGVHEGVDRDQLEPLIGELLAYVNEAEVPSVFLRAAMAHLNLVLLHPFTDGNGRSARCIQSAVLASDGILAPPFSSIEEYIGRNQQQYYEVLAEVGGGGWKPLRNAKPWVRFCLTGHYRQAQTLLRRMREVERVYAEMTELVRLSGPPNAPPPPCSRRPSAVGYGTLRIGSVRTYQRILPVATSRRSWMQGSSFPEAKSAAASTSHHAPWPRFATGSACPGTSTTPSRKTHGYKRPIVGRTSSSEKQQHTRTTPRPVDSTLTRVSFP